MASIGVNARIFDGNDSQLEITQRELLSSRTFSLTS
jgi:hypothetical protein